MSKFKKLIKSPHIHIALATGFSIIIMAMYRKRLIENYFMNPVIRTPEFSQHGIG
jgi:hypothetical protein